MKIRMKFSKQGPLKFIGHLDIMRYFQKVMRRADVDIRYSEGFSPHQIMSFASPLGVGILSNGEYVDIEVNSTKDSKTMIEQINRENAEGFCVLSYRKLDDSVKNAMSQVAAADYTMWFREGYEPEDVPRFMKNLLAFCHSDKIEIVKPTEIEKRSMEIITSELNGRTWPEPEFSIVKRCIHTSADFDYADNLCFSENAAMLGVEALRRGAVIVTDTRMAWSGINKKKLAEYGGEAFCFMSDADVAQEAKDRGCTRAAICMERGAALGKEVIFAVGNAPTALIRLYELIKAGEVKPALIIGAPVGFVNVVEAKELIMTAGVPYIVPKGRKGGSNIAATICNAMLYYKG